VKATEQTIILPFDSEADKKAADEFVRALARQVGYTPRLDVHKDDKGKLWVVGGWKMTRQEQAAVAMFQRRGAKPKDEQGKPTKALITTKDVEKKNLADVTSEKKLTKQTTVSAVGGQKEQERKSN
jgi:hypothetical protein